LVSEELLAKVVLPPAATSCHIMCETVTAFQIATFKKNAGCGIRGAETMVMLAVTGYCAYIFIFYMEAE